MNVRTDQRQRGSCRTRLSLNCSYVCPEPVLVKLIVSHHKDGSRQPRFRPHPSIWSPCSEISVGLHRYCTFHNDCPTDARSDDRAACGMRSDAQRCRHSAEALRYRDDLESALPLLLQRCT